MHLSTYRNFLPTILFLSICFHCRAQKADSAYYKYNNIYYWIEANGGITSLGNNIGGSINILRNGYLFAFKISGALSSVSTSKRAPKNFAVTGGFKMLPGKYNNVALSAGLEILDAVEMQGTVLYDNTSGSYNSSVYYMASRHYIQYGLPVELKYIHNSGFAGTAGFSIAATAHLDSGTPYFSATIGVAFGKLREAKP